MKTLQDYMTGERLQRIADQWEKTAGETISIEVMEEDMCAFGSELACLRLEHHFKRGECETDVAYSTNLQTWYFLLRKVYSKQWLSGRFFRPLLSFSEPKAGKKVTKKPLLNPLKIQRVVFLCRYYWLEKRQILIFAAATVYSTATFRILWQ